jgi:peptidyl-prolyl cis-trans isomerase D
MISWLQSTFKKHYQLIFFLMLCALIVPFVFTIGATPGIGPAGTKTLEQPFFGYNLSREEDQRRIFGDASYSVMLKAGYPALQGAQLQEYALQRVAGLALADQLRLPAATEAQVSEYVSKLAVFQDENGRFDPQRYARFGDSLKGNPQFTAADAGRVLRADARLDQLQKLLGGPGYVLPREVREQLVRAESTWTLQVASLDYAKFDAGVTVTDADLARFFEENSFRYQVPQRYRLSLVEFKAADFQPTGTPTEEQLRNYYNANPARFPVPPEAAKKDVPAVSLDPAAPAGAQDDFAKVRDQVLAALRQEAALANASKAASDFTIALYEGKVAANSSKLDAALAARRLTAAPLPPLNP